MSAHRDVSVWLEARTPAPPPLLAARLGDMTAGIARREASADAFLHAAEAAMTGLLGAGGLTREDALDLLAIDALVTYAFEAAADDPERLDACAQRALVRISTLAEPYDA